METKESSNIEQHTLTHKLINTVIEDDEVL